MEPTLTDPGAVLVREEQIQARLLEQIWRILLVVTLVGGAASLRRAVFTGWIPLYSLHVFLISLVLLCFVFRKKMPFELRVKIALLIFYSVGIAGIFALGLLSGGIWWLILAALLARVFYSNKIGLIHCAVCLLITSLAGVAITTEFIQIPYDANEYIKQPSTWITLVIGCVMLSLFIFSALTTYQRETISLLREVDKNRHELKKALNEIKLLQSFLPICVQCKKIRDDKGYWENVEAYLQKHSDMKFSHCLCPPCGHNLYGDLWTSVTSNNDNSGTTK